jgi:pSer/pThr/pTyr-binding forkhead associated (FHA) protein
MPLLELTVVDVPSQRRETFLFARSPVRLGRSTLNELVIDHEFVSGIHGVLRFGADVSYVDMGSRNGSQVNGQAVKSHQPAALAAGAELVVGQFVLTARVLPDAPVGDDDDAPEPPPGRYAFGAAEGGVPAADKPAPVRAETTALPFGFDIRKLAPEPAPPEVDLPIAPAVPPRPFDEPVVPPALVGFTKPLVPAGSASETPPSTVSSALERLRELGRTQPNPNDNELVLRSADLLELFAGKLLALRDSVDVTGRELGVRPFSARPPLYLETDPQQVLDHLLTTGTAAPRREEVARLFTDLFAHQVAFLGALREGVGALLDRLHPEAGGVEPGLFGGGALKRYREHFEDEAEHAWETVLGQAFGQTYAEMMSESSPPRAAADREPAASIRDAPLRGLATLDVISGPTEARRFPLPAGDVVIGRASDCDIPLDHQSISRRHARVTHAAGAWTIRDLDSANGVLVNGEKFRAAELDTGDVVQIGLVQMRFEAG